MPFQLPLDILLPTPFLHFYEYRMQLTFLSSPVWGGLP